MILREEKDRNSLWTPGSSSTLTIATGSNSSSSAAVNIFEDMDENNADENEEVNFDDYLL